MLTKKINYVIGLSLFGCVASTEQPIALPVSELIPAPNARVYFSSKGVDTRTAAYLYRDNLLDYQAYLDRYVIELTAALRLSPLPVAVSTCDLDKSFPTMTLPDIPNVRGLDDSEIIDALITHIEDLEKTVSRYKVAVNKLQRELKTSC